MLSDLIGCPKKLRELRYARPQLNTEKTTLSEIFLGSSIKSKAILENLKPTVCQSTPN